MQTNTEVKLKTMFTTFSGESKVQVIISYREGECFSVYVVSTPPSLLSFQPFDLSVNNKFWEEIEIVLTHLFLDKNIRFFMTTMRAI